MPHGRPPISTTTRLYGYFAYSTVQRPMPVPALMNALLERRGVDTVFVPLQVPPEHVAATVIGCCHMPRPAALSTPSGSTWMAA